MEKIENFVRNKELQKPQKLSRFVKRCHLFGLLGQALFVAFELPELGFSGILIPLIGIITTFMFCGKKFVDKIDGTDELKRAIELKDAQQSGKYIGSFLAPLFLSLVCYWYCEPSEMGVLTGLFFNASSRITILSVIVFTIIDVYRVFFIDKIM
ncbi:Hypothetical protein SRAE_2000209100 [Strongyloides ratti]|uniref:DUF7087 domain-containing protein n=1 Tax=Strongyloides ratti TaxID=34506 RepID=A0A090LCC9_STRRB|nr:Hypothetical protein SRAE_2000209100 [Strongyloides ratti]CEF67427.1 Hypothetical protein SRAE_2000209100 [Strongyloides ratti]